MRDRRHFIDVLPVKPLDSPSPESARGAERGVFLLQERGIERVMVEKKERKRERERERERGEREREGFPNSSNRCSP